MNDEDRLDKLLNYEQRIAELDAENQRLRERNEQLEHWFHGYRTPEESMAALVAENQRLQEHIWQLETSIQDLIAKQALEKER